MVTVDLDKEETRIILTYLKAYLGLHQKDLQEDEIGEIKRVIEKIEKLS
jgi:hypothetical protein